MNDAGGSYVCVLLGGGAGLGGNNCWCNGIGFVFFSTSVGVGIL